MNDSNKQASSQRCWVEVHSDALRHNAEALKARTSASLMAVVKANGYGHGTAIVVRALSGCVAMFGVANLTEAREVRAQCATTPVFILGAALPCERESIVREGFMVAVSSTQEAAAYCQLGHADLHLVIDTGMGRMGVWKDDAVNTAREILALPGATLAGVCSHLSCADSDADFTASQLEAFRPLASKIQAMAGRKLLVHVENTAATLAYPADAACIVRCGIALYGVSPIPVFQNLFRPALSWKTRVILVRKFAPGRSISYGRTFISGRTMKVATLSAGYADGYPRQLSGNQASVLIREKRCPVLGRVTMDQIMVDVSEVPGVESGEEAVLLGGEITADELATKAGTIPWDILTGIGQRVARIAV
jgi:alanine racemase